MQIVRDLGGYSYGRSDLVRRAMSKKKKDVMLQEKEYFINGKLDENGNVEIAGCIRNGISRQAAEAIFEDMETFAQYAFNKSHAAAYAVVAYETGYLKKHYPVEFMAALMTSVMSDAKMIARYIRNCSDMGIEVLPPSVNKSLKKFSVEDGKIRFGLLGVKNVGENVIEAILKAREEKGEPSDIFTFINNLDISQVNKRAIESLIKAGACDCLEGNRAAKLAVYETLVESAQNTSKKNLEGQISLFQMASDAMSSAGTGKRLPDVQAFPLNIELAMEKEMLGVYLTGHPLDAYKEKMERISSVTSDDLMQIEEESGTAQNHAIRDGMSCIISGMIAGKKTLITKSNKMMAFIDLEDLYGITEVVIFPNVYEKCAEEIQDDRVVAIKGTLNFKEDEAPKVLADEVLDIDAAIERGFSQRERSSYGGGNRSGYSSNRGAHGNRTAPQGNPAAPQQRASASETQASVPSAKRQPAGMVKLRIPADMDEVMTLEEIKVNLKRHKGDYEVLIYLPSGKMFRTEESLWVSPSEELRKQMASILRVENVKM